MIKTFVTANNSHLLDKYLFSISSGFSEWASKKMSAVERASKASRAEQANETAVRANERMEKRLAQYSMQRFHIISTHSAVV